MKKSAFAFCLSCTILATFPAFAASEVGKSCQDFSTTVTKQVVDIFQNKNKTIEQKQQELSGIFQSAVDTDWIGKFVIGSAWNSATPEQQKSYLDTYKNYLTTIYVSKLNGDNTSTIDDIVIASMKPQLAADQFEAHTLIKRGGQPDVAVDYLLDQSSGKCQVHDIKVENVSLLISERSEFKSVATASGIDGVTAAMKKQLADN